MTPDPSADAAIQIESAALPLLAPMLRSAAQMHAEGVCSFDDLDTAMRLGARHPAGPLEIIASLDPGTREELGLPEVRRDIESAAMGPEGVSAEPAERWSDAPVGVVGSGFMAAGIAYAIVAAGQEVRLWGRTPEATAAAVERVEAGLARAVSRGHLDEEQARAAAARLATATELKLLRPCDLVIEAVAEDLTIKRAVFTHLDAALPRTELLATNTSSLRVTDIATAVARPRRVGALHFFSPVAAMKLVEVVEPMRLPVELVDRGAAWVRSLDKVPVRSVDRPGFIVNALLVPFLNDAVRAHENGHGTITDIDQLITTGAGFPMGPFALLDFIGLDISLAAQRSIFDAAGGERLRPARLLVENVAAGRLGRKAGLGFYDYTSRSPTPVSPS